MLSCNTLLNHTQLNAVENEWLSYFLGRFFYMGPTSYFSLFPWVLFPAVGYHFANHYKTMEESRQHIFVGSLLKWCCFALAALSVALLGHGISPSIANIIRMDYQTGLLSVVLMILLSGISFCIGHFIVMKFPASRFLTACQRISRVIVPFYVIQWIIFGWSGLVLDVIGKEDMFHSVWEVNCIAIIVAAISLFLAFRFDKYQKRFSRKSRK